MMLMMVTMLILMIYTMLMLTIITRLMLTVLMKPILIHPADTDDRHHADAGDPYYADADDVTLLIKSNFCKTLLEPSKYNVSKGAIDAFFLSSKLCDKLFKSAFGERFFVKGSLSSVIHRITRGFSPTPHK